MPWKRTFVLLGLVALALPASANSTGIELDQPYGMSAPHPGKPVVNVVVLNSSNSVNERMTARRLGIVDVARITITDSSSRRGSATFSLFGTGLFGIALLVRRKLVFRL